MTQVVLVSELVTWVLGRLGVTQTTGTTSSTVDWSLLYDCDWFHPISQVITRLRSIRDCGHWLQSGERSRKVLRIENLLERAFIVHNHNINGPQVSQTSGIMITQKVLFLQLWRSLTYIPLHWDLTFFKKLYSENRETVVRVVSRRKDRTPSLMENSFL